MLYNTKNYLVSNFEVEDETDLKEKQNPNYTDLTVKINYAVKHNFAKDVFINNIDIYSFALNLDMLRSEKIPRFYRKKLKNANNVKLKLDYTSVDKRDVYGFYLTNKSTKSSTKAFPEIGCFVNVIPNFIALESEKALYYKTNKTCIAWFRDDSTFDTIDGLYNAIIYKNTLLLKYYKERYKDVKFFISPDYSLYGDFDDTLILNNLRKQLIVSLWLIFELEAIVFPLMTYSNEESINWCFEHIMLNSNVAISLKGVMKEPNKSLFVKALKKLIDDRQPKALIVYSVAKVESTKEMLKYAYQNNLPVYIIDNTLLRRNRGNING